MPFLHSDCVFYRNILQKQNKPYHTNSCISQIFFSNFLSTLGIVALWVNQGHYNDEAYSVIIINGWSAMGDPESCVGESHALIGPSFV